MQSTFFACTPYCAEVVKTTCRIFWKQFFYQVPARNAISGKGILSAVIRKGEQKLHFGRKATSPESLIDCPAFICKFSTAKICPFQPRANSCQRFMLLRTQIFVHCNWWILSDCLGPGPVEISPISSSWIVWFDHGRPMACSMYCKLWKSSRCTVPPDKLNNAVFLIRRLLRSLLSEYASSSNEIKRAIKISKSGCKMTSRGICTRTQPARLLLLEESFLEEQECV